MTKSSDLSRLMAELRAITVAHAQPRRIIELVRPLMAGLAPTRRGLITAAGFIKAGDTRCMKSGIMAWRFSRSRGPGRRDTSSHPDDSGYGRNPNHTGARDLMWIAAWRFRLLRARSWLDE